MPRLVMAIAALSTLTGASAAWEQIHERPTTQAHFITSDGTFLLSDFLDNRTGGIFISTDRGMTWEQTAVRDYNYHTFYETDGYVFAIGYNARIARSADNGRTWEVLNYSKALEGVIEDKAIDSCVTYSMEKRGDRLYIGDFAGGGVLYSTDFGESWNLTDRESLMINIEGIGPSMDSFYNLVDFAGSLYAFGALSVHRYDDTADKWEPVNINSNFMAVSTIVGNRLVCGRANPNFDSELEYLLWTEDGETWNRIEAPEAYTEAGISRNVRAIHSDDTYIYTTGPDGLTPNPEPVGAPYITCPDFFYTSDFGETWTRVDGLPARHYPLTIQTDADYVYVALYSPFENVTTSGLWRLPKSELSSASVDSINGGDSAKVRISDNILTTDGAEALSITVYDTAGKKLIQTSSGAADISSLGEGIYIYGITTPDGNISGKFNR